MAKHSKKKSSLGAVVFGLVMAIAVVAGLISIISGKTAANEDIVNIQMPTVQEQSVDAAKKNDEPAQSAQPSIDPGKPLVSQEAGAEPEPSEEPIVDANGEKLVFGQIPQSTENADPNEPDVTSTEPPKTETPAAQTETPEAPAAQTEIPAMPTVQTETPSSTTSGNITTTTTVTDDWLLLANKTHHLSEDYWPGDMVTVSSCVEGVGNNDTKKLRKIAADALEELIQGAADAGYKIKMRTGFRSYNYQVSLFNSYVAKNGEEAANKFSAKAGESEHQTGLCCDVSSPSVSWGLSYQYGETEEGKWLAEHCHEYGFIVRYLKGKEDITGYNYEPWHIRYVGVDVATEIFNKGICFEEYLGITD